MYESRNSYGNMGRVLNSLGLLVSNQSGYQRQFGITLSNRTPTLIRRQDQKLLADTTTMPVEFSDASSTAFKTVRGEIMFLIDLPDLTPIESPVLLAEVQQAATKHGKYYAQAGVCKVAPSSDNKIVAQIGNGNSVGEIDLSRLGRSDYVLTPAADVIDAFVLKDPEVGQSYRAGIVPPNMENRVDYFNMDSKDVAIKVIQETKHGHLHKWAQSSEIIYVPNPGFSDVDYFVLEGVAQEGHKVKLTYEIHVIGNNEFQKAHSDLTIFSKILQKLCPNNIEWLAPNSGKSSNFPGYQTPAS
jgi:hypothetical protein